MHRSPGAGCVGGGNLDRRPLLAVSLPPARAALRWPLILQDKRNLLFYPCPDLHAIRKVLDAGHVVRFQVARQSEGVYFGEALV